LGIGQKLKVRYQLKVGEKFGAFDHSVLDQNAKPPDYKYFDLTKNENNHRYRTRRSMQRRT
jgi:hypothetical protein